jgi:hypothetical protein
VIADKRDRLKHCEHVTAGERARRSAPKAATFRVVNRSAAPQIVAT